MKEEDRFLGGGAGPEIAIATKLRNAKIHSPLANICGAGGGGVVVLTIM